MTRKNGSVNFFESLEDRCLLSAVVEVQSLHAVDSHAAVVMTATKTAAPKLVGTWKGTASIATYKNLPVTMKITSQANGRIKGTLTITGFGVIPVDSKVTYTGTNGFTATVSKSGLTGTLKGKLVTASKITGTLAAKYAGQNMPGTFSLNKP